MLHLKNIGIFVGAFRLQNQGTEVWEQEKKKEKFNQHRKEIKDFTRFLKKNYPDYLFRRLKV